MPRISLTRRQRESEAGVELLSLCQTITEDGHLSDEEVGQLREWLRANEDAELPARDHLYAIVEQILRDGRITDDERRELYRAIETVLPPDLRPLAKLRRQEREGEERERQKEARAHAKQEKERDRLRNRPVGRFNFMVAGVRHEGRAAVVAQHVRAAQLAHLQRDPGNRYSRNAIEVQTQAGHMIGYVPEEEARELAPLLDAGAQYHASFTKILGRGNVPIPVVDCFLYSADATQEGLTRHEAVPQRTEAEKTRPTPASPPTRAIAEDARSMPPWKLIVGVAIALVVLAMLFG